MSLRFDKEVLPRRIFVFAYKILSKPVMEPDKTNCSAIELVQNSILSNKSPGSLLRSISDTQNSTQIIQASYFMTYHSICISSEDCQRNLEEARFLADNITQHIHNVLGLHTVNLTVLTVRSFERTARAPKIKVLEVVDMEKI